MFYTLTKLEVLYLKENKLTKLIGSFHRDHSLKTVILDHNPFEVITRDTLSPIENLKTLSISYMPNLTKIDAEAFSGFRSLETLECIHNLKLEEFDSYAFANMTDEENFPLKKVSCLEMYYSVLHFDNHMQILKFVKLDSQGKGIALLRDPVSTSKFPAAQHKQQKNVGVNSTQFDSHLCVVIQHKKSVLILM